MPQLTSTVAAGLHVATGVVEGLTALVVALFGLRRRAAKRQAPG